MTQETRRDVWERLVQAMDAGRLERQRGLLLQRALSAASFALMSVPAANALTIRRCAPR
jgi:hypothetical protein